MKTIKIIQYINESATNYINKEINNKTARPNTIDFLNKLSNSTTDVILEFIKNNANKISINSKNGELYSYKNLILARTNGETALNIENNVGLAQKLGIAPKYIQHFKLGENDFLSILDTNTNNLIPYVPNASKIPTKVKELFKQKLRLLANNNIINRNIVGNKSALLTNSNGEKILFADWSELVNISKTEKNNYLEFLNSWKF